VSVSFAAVELAKKIFGTLAGKKILIIGAGEMAELTCTHLIGNGAEDIIVANRSATQAQTLAEKYHGRAMGLDALDEGLMDADIVISSTGAPTYIVTQEMIRGCLRKRKNRLLFLIDIAVPRDIDPAVDSIENVYLYNIDNLQDIVDENIKNRRREALKAEEIVAFEVAQYLNWLKELEAVPTIVSLRTKAEGIVRMELAKAESWMSKLENGDREKVDALVNGIVNKLLHAPVAVMKEESVEFDSQDIVAAARQLFRLDD
jgi:glutamyl-tRNA reductase